MLFDLTGSGRRRAVKVIYATLALLLGGGLVLFGIGGDVQGGLVDAFREDSQRTDNPFKERIERTEERIKANRQDAAAWAELARLRFQNAGLEGYDQAQGTFTDSGRSELQKADRAWQQHLRIAGEDKANPTVANSMVQAYTALGKPDAAVRAMEVYLDSQEDPTAQLYAQYAIYAYQAGQSRKGDLAAKRAQDLATSKEERETIKSTIDQAKAQGVADAAEQPTPAG